MEGKLDRAVELYKDSLDVFPTAEAHTFLGWTYHFQGKVHDAIAECKLAIEVDPDFGNPYNDIGAYLISLKRYDEAIAWLELATKAPRYDPRHYPYFNLGRVYFAKGMINRARECFRRARFGFSHAIETAAGIPKRHPANVELSRRCRGWGQLYDFVGKAT